MDAPKCKICGERHYQRVACDTDAEKFRRQFTYGKPKAAAVESVRRGTEMARQLNENGGKLTVTLPAKPKFDREAYHRTYMREYMRKRRAAAKARKT